MLAVMDYLAEVFLAFFYIAKLAFVSWCISSHFLSDETKKIRYGIDIFSAQLRSSLPGDKSPLSKTLAVVLVPVRKNQRAFCVFNRNMGKIGREQRHSTTDILNLLFISVSIAIIIYILTCE